MLYPAFDCLSVCLSDVSSFTQKLPIESSREVAKDVSLDREDITKIPPHSTW